MSEEKKPSLGEQWITGSIALTILVSVAMLFLFNIPVDERMRMLAFFVVSSIIPCGLIVGIGMMIYKNLNK